MTLLVGTKTLGASDEYVGSGVAEYYLNMYTAVASGTASQIGVNIQRTGSITTARLAIYDSGNNLLGQTETFVPTTGEQLVNLESSVSITSGNSYGFGVIAEGSAWDLWCDDTGGVSSIQDGSVTVSGGFPATASGSSDAAPGKGVMWAEDSGGGGSSTLLERQTRGVMRGVMRGAR